MPHRDWVTLLPAELRQILLSYAKPTELRQILLSYAKSYWATPHTSWATPIPSIWKKPSSTIKINIFKYHAYHDVNNPFPVLQINIKERHWPLSLYTFKVQRMATVSNVEWSPPRSHLAFSLMCELRMTKPEKCQRIYRKKISFFKPLMENCTDVIAIMKCCKRFRE
jgi:hypothetical protein